MRLEFRDHDKLVPSRTNMRFAKKPPDVADLLPSVRARGVLVPLIVRDQPDDPSTSEIIAGLRRWTADGIVRTEGIDHGPLPCAILESGDDADAIEASLIENVARRDPDEVSQWESFVKLVREGRDPADLGATFGIPETGVRRILALGNLLPRIRSLYRAEEIDPATIRHLTMASKKQQSAWLALFDDPDAYVPTGHQLKSWLLGGQSIPTRHALFDLASYKGALVADLFGEDSYFADPEAFWTAQNEAIAAARDAYLDAGWGDVAVLPVGEYFHSWEYARAAKRKGGRIYVELRATGEVVFHEGYQTRKEARARERGETAAAGEKPVRPEVTGRSTPISTSTAMPPCAPR
jgi:ParB family chromosome partitioning protein